MDDIVVKYLEVYEDLPYAKADDVRKLLFALNVLHLLLVTEEYRSPLNSYPQTLRALELAGATRNPIASIEAFEFAYALMGKGLGKARWRWTIE